MLLIEHGCQHGDDHSIVLLRMTFDVYDDTDDIHHDDDGHDDLGHVGQVMMMMMMMAMLDLI